MPLRVSVNGKEVVMTPTESMQSVSYPTDITSVEVNRNYLVDTENLK
ncbi:MAG: hypothetical protein IPP63_17340 [Chloracidobacterium sp.]|nr:hypothetical protein [Chloracidobacterium sp.]